MADRGPGLVSVGYEGRTVEDLLLIFRQTGVDIVADVRLTPMSRKPGLRKTRLRQALEDVGVDYVQLRDLGNPRDNREPFWSDKPTVGIPRFRQLLREPSRSASVDELVEMSRTHRVAILCFEREHERCHRQVVTEEVTARSASTDVVFA